MSNLVEFAYKELRDAGLFDEDSDYDGELGMAVMELIHTFADQGHSGYSAQLVIHLFSQLAKYQMINVLKNPMETGEYIVISGDMLSDPSITMLQSTRDSAMFSDDGGKSWYHLDKYRTRTQRVLYWLAHAPVIGKIMYALPIKWWNICRGKVTFGEMK